MLIVSLNIPIVVLASDDHGADAHSESMGAGAAELTVDESVELEETQEAVEEAAQEDDSESASEELAEEAEEVTDSMFNTMSNNWIYIAAGLGAIALIIVIVAMTRLSGNKHKNSTGSSNYKPKH